MSDDDEEYARLRVRESDRELLNRMKDSQHVKRHAVDEGIIDDRDDVLTYPDLIYLIIPDDAEPISYEMAWVHLRDEEAKDRVLDLAGENISAHHVVRKFLDDYTARIGTSLQ